MDGDGVVLSARDPTTEDPRKGRRVGRRGRLPRQLHRGRNHPAGSPEHWIQDIRHLRRPQRRQRGHRVGALPGDGGVHARIRRLPVHEHRRTGHEEAVLPPTSMVGGISSGGNKAAA